MSLINICKSERFHCPSVVLLTVSSVDAIACLAVIEIKALYESDLSAMAPRIFESKLSALAFA